ncbi:clostripain-related cysteine peptidase [Parabacteroides bouchesdurhonensis]|uniref:clostripain-related cysteine peptidase n=1 Tax=Parabacteroides bouchesdurhonensis TaxID=1936995 RepID=UPI000E52FA75|nr:clostripain-related cysteine peptidase [Parabacteroides bouchesdurhonensis]RHJ90782.1 clostripain [Bacteroides sp. AM07-16]
MKYRIISVFLCLIVLLCACADNEDEISVKKRTVLVYVAAENTLRSLALNDFVEMKEGTEYINAAENNMLVYIDTGSEPRLVRLTKDKSGEVVEELISEYESQNSLDVSVMKDIMSTAFQKYPADSYGLVLWSHGEGWLPNETNLRWWGQDGNNFMEIAQLHEALQAAPHFDFIYFDACFMNSVEVVYELRDCADYFIGCPTETPGPGAPYQRTVPLLFSKEDAPVKVAQDYFLYYKDLYDENVRPSNINWTGGVSIGVIKSDELDNLAMATAKLLPKYIQNKQSIDVTDVMCYDKRSYYKYYYDLDRFIYKLTAGNSDYAEWKSVFDKAAVLWLSTPKNFSGLIKGLFTMDENAGGLSTYIPRSYSSSLNEAYRANAWYQAAGWPQTGW